jgi:hypothetical protein
MRTAIAMNRPALFFAALASAAVLAAPLAPLDAVTMPVHRTGDAGSTVPQAPADATRTVHRPRAGHAKKTSARATAWTREDPSFPFRWDGCEPIPYRVNLGGTPPRNLRVLKAALAQISAASGFTFRYAGPTSAVPFERGSDAMDQVPGDGLTVAWTTAAVVPRLAGSVVGLGGPGVSDERVGTQWQVESAGVAIDKSARLSTRTADGPTLLSLLLHELGHAMGLGHSPSKANVMYAGLGPWSRPYLGPGDLAGLHDLGGC